MLLVNGILSSVKQKCTQTWNKAGALEPRARERGPFVGLRFQAWGVCVPESPQPRRLRRCERKLVRVPGPVPGATAVRKRGPGRGARRAGLAALSPPPSPIHGKRGAARLPALCSELASSLLHGSARARAFDSHPGLLLEGVEK